MKLLILTLSSLILFLASLHPVVDYDTFFGLKIGELVVQTGQIPSAEVFSWAAADREWIAYEWLSQTIVYLVHRLSGFQGISLYVAAVFTAFFLLSVLLFRNVLKRDFASSIVLAVFLVSSIYEFFVSRPQIISYTLLLVFLILIFQFILHNSHFSSRMLWLSIPLTYVWTNTHASFVFVPYLFFSYALFGFLYHKLQGEGKGAKKIAGKLTTFGLVNLLVTLAPPLWHKPYVLLWQFTEDLTFLTQFVGEWGGLNAYPTHKTFYLLLVGGVLLISFFFSARQFPKAKKQVIAKWLLAIPLLLICLLSFQAIRHVALGAITALVILAIFLPRFRFKGFALGASALAFSMVLLVLSFWQIMQKREGLFDAQWNLPHEAVTFLLTHRLEGNMFNEFALGGFLIYHLYPEYQVFFDGRADVYHKYEMRDFWPLIANKRASREDFANIAKEFLGKYDFSFAVVPYTSYNPLEATATTLLAEVLLDDKDWQLVYFDDRVQILVKRDEKNSSLLKALGMSAVTPYRISPYRRGEERSAEEEYQKMIGMQESGMAYNGLGQIFLSQKEYGKAKRAFAKARQRNPKIGTPLVGLGKVALEEAEVLAAISHFKDAIGRAPYLGEAYVWLGKTYLVMNQPELAKQVFEQGLSENIDFLTRRELIQELSKIN